MILFDKFGEKLDIGFNPNWFEDIESDENQMNFAFDLAKALESKYDFNFDYRLFNAIYLVMYTGEESDAVIVVLPDDGMTLGETGMTEQVCNVYLTECEIKSLKEIKGEI
jgi:hypothetical protein